MAETKRRLTWADLSESAQTRMLVCLEESSHAVMAVLAGGRIDTCEVSADGGHVEFYDHDPERAPGIGWAGSYAQLLFQHGDHPPENAVRHALAHVSPEDRELMDRGRYRSVEADVRFAMPAIRRLAAHLHRHGTARTLDVWVALGLRPGVDTNMIRWAYRQRIDPATVTPAGSAA